MNLVLEEVFSSIVDQHCLGAIPSCCSMVQGAEDKTEEELAKEISEEMDEDDGI